MTTQLSYADREYLLQALDRFSTDDTSSNDQLLNDIARWARSLEPRFGFEHSLVRNITQLSCHLRDCADQNDIAGIARGAIQCVLGNQQGLAHFAESSEQNVPVPLTASERKLLSDAFVVSYAVHEISLRLGTPITYNPPAISKNERTKAEDMFLRLTVDSGMSDDDLIAQAKSNLGELHNLAQCGFLRRLEHNACLLIAALNDPQQTDEHKYYARGALRYLVEDDDVIGDDLGLIGYLDDYFVVQMAVDFINSDREPLVELLDEVVGVWPFINSLFLDDGSGNRPTSEFAILNSALSCRTLRPEDSLRTILIAPDSGPIPIVVGFVASLGLAQESGQRELTEDSFRNGQKVIVDYSAVAEFAGFEMLGDRKMFKLRQYYTDRGQRLQTVRSWPVADLRRLIPADSSRSIRGAVKHDLSRSDMLLPGLEYLFNAGKTADVTAIEKRIIVVTPTTLAAEFCKSVQLYGQALKDVVPMGHLSADGESVERWSSRFGLKEPILVFVSDLDVATKFAEQNPQRNQLVIVDVAGRNAGKNASLRRLTRFKIPSLLIVSERSANELELAEGSGGVAIWEWTADDFLALLWPECKPDGEPGELVRFEQKLKSSVAIEPEVVTVQLPLAGETHARFLQLRRLAKQRGEEHIAALDELVTLGYWVTTQLIRCATPLDQQLPSLGSLIGWLAKVEELSHGSNYLTADEQDAANTLSEFLRKLLESLRQRNPKADAMRKLLDRYPSAAIICPDARLLCDLEVMYGNSASWIIVGCTTSESFENGLIVPGWFRQSRMASLLSPPVADPIAMVMYDVERKWYSSFVNERRTVRQQRRARSNRASIFLRLKDWPQPKPMETSPSESESELQELEEVRSEVLDHYKNRIYRTTSTSDHEVNVPVRLVMFVGGSYGFFTASYKLNVVSHLIENATVEADEKATVIQKTTDKLEPGDAIVFRLSSRDVIREVADAVLEPGTRELSSLWRSVLLRFVEQRNLSAAQLCQQLRDAGCKVQQQTVQNWLNFDDMIAPQAYKRDVAASAKITGAPAVVGRMAQVAAGIHKVREAHLQQLNPYSKALLYGLAA